MECQRLVQEFRLHFYKMIEEMEQKHVNELFRLHAMKKSYSDMVKLSGKEFVELQLCVSREQAWRTTRRESYYLDGVNTSNPLVEQFNAVLW